VKTRQIAIMGLLTATGTLSSHILAIPVAGAKVFPVQHAVNVISAVTLGPSHAVAVAFGIALLRNFLGTGTLLAFPGSMIGAFVAGRAYRATGAVWWAACGEVFGTGVLGALVSYPIARVLMGKDVAALAYVLPFGTSSMAGALIGSVVLVALRRAKMLWDQPAYRPRPHRYTRT